MKKLIFLFAFLFSFISAVSGNIIWMNEGYVQSIIGAAISDDCNYLALSKYGTHGSSIQFWDLVNKKRIIQDTFANVTAILVNDKPYFCYYLPYNDNRALIIRDINGNIITTDTMNYDLYSIKSIPNQSHQIMVRRSKDAGQTILFSNFDFENHKFKADISIDKVDDYVNSNDNFIFSPDGKYLVFYYTTSYGIRENKPYNMVYIYNLETKELKSKAVQKYRINSLTISEDSKYLITAAGGDIFSIAYWDLIEGDTIKTIASKSVYLTSMKFIGSNKLIISDKFYHYFHLFDLNKETDSLLFKLNDTYDYGFFLSDSKYLSVSGNTIKFWTFSYDNNPEITLNTTLNDINTNNHTESAIGVDISPNNSLIATGGRDKVVKIWDSESGDFLYNIINNNSSTIISIKFSHDGNKLAWISYDPKSSFIISTVEEHNSIYETSIDSFKVYDIAWSPYDKSIAVCGSNDKVYVFDPETGDLQYILTGSTKSIRTIEFSPDGSLLAVGNYDGNLIVWRVSDKQIVYQGKVIPKNWVNSIDFSPDGKLLVVAGMDTYAQVFETSTWTLVKKFNSKSDGFSSSSISQVLFSPDSKYIVGGFLGSLFKVWDYESSNNYKLFYDLNNLNSTMVINRLAISNDGKFIVCVTDNGDVVKWVGLDVTAVEEPQKNSDEAIYPNPANDYIYIKNNYILNSNIQIFNSLGIKMLETVYQDRIDVSAFAPGLYFVKSNDKIYTFIKI